MVHSSYTPLTDFTNISDSYILSMAISGTFIPLELLIITGTMNLNNSDGSVLK